MNIEKIILYLILVITKNLIAGEYRPVERLGDQIVAIYVRTKLDPEILNNLFNPMVNPTTKVTKSNWGVYTIRAWQWRKVSSLLAVAVLINEPDQEIVNELKNRIAIFER